jgi:modification methylase
MTKDNNLPLDTILPGDCLEVLPQIPENSIDVIFADPPYNLQLSQDLWRPNQTRVAGVDDSWDKFPERNEYDQFTRNWLAACKRVLKKTGTIWTIGTYHSIYRVGAILQDLDYWILNDIIWIKTNPMPNFRGVRFTNAHETLIWAQKKKGASYTFNHHAIKSLNDDLQMRSDWTFPLCTGKERIRANGEKSHSTQKPEALLYRILLATTNPGDVVLDPFFGTGTTGTVARKLGRHFIGIEREKRYIKLAMDRIASVEPFPEIAVNLSDDHRGPRIPFGTLLEAGLLEPGQKLYFSKDESKAAIILSNGKITYGNQTGSIHSIAKFISNDAPVNGWECWLYEDHGKRQSINDLRQTIQLKEVAKNGGPSNEK